MDDQYTDAKTRLLDTAESLVLDRGFAATSLAMIVAEAGVTKGSFFHHFDSKNDLGRELIERFSRRDRRFLEATMESAEALSRDPLQQLLIFIGLLAEEFKTGHNPLKGCLFASYVYQQGIFDAETIRVAQSAFARWRRAVSEKLQEVRQQYTPKIPVDMESLADSITVVTEGGFVTSRVFEQPEVMVDHLIHLRNYLELLFQPSNPRGGSQ